MTYEDKISYNIEKVRSYIDVLVQNGHQHFAEFAVSIAERLPAFYLRNRWQLEDLWNRNTSICHTEIASHEEIVRGVENADSILRECGHIAMKRHVFPNDPSEHPLPFFFLELIDHRYTPELVVKCQGVFRNTTKQYLPPVKLPSAHAEASFDFLQPYIPECVWEYLFEILKTLNIVFEIKRPRNSIAGNCKLDMVNGIAHVTVNASLNKWKFLCVVLHEVSHALNPSLHSPHDACWKAIYAALIADFYDFFPEEYKCEVLWGMVYTPASLCTTNFHSRAVLFGLSDTLTENVRSRNLLGMKQLKHFELAKDSAGVIQDSQDTKLSHNVGNADSTFEELSKHWGLAARLVKVYLDKGIIDFKTLVCQMSKDYPKLFPTVKSSLRGVWNYVVAQKGLPVTYEVSKDDTVSIYAEITKAANAIEDSEPSLAIQTGVSKEYPSLVLRGKNVSGFLICREDIAPCELPYDFSYAENTFVERYESRRRFSGELYIPLDLKADQRFFRFLYQLPARSQSIVWSLYAREYGEGAYRYARSTEYDWKRGTVQGWAAGRFFELVPIVFPLSRKKELFKTILDASDSMRARKLHYRDITPNQILVSIADFALKSPLVIRHLQSFGTKEAQDFDYDKIYDFNNWSVPLWMKQADVEAYRKELSVEKRTEILTLMNELDGKIKQLKEEFVKKGQASLTINFPSKSFNIRIVSPFRGIIHNIALAFGFSKDFL